MNQLPVIVTRFARVVLPAIVLASCGSGYEELPSYRYRLTVEVETPEGIRSGSSVIEVRTWLAGPNTVPNPNVIRTRENGEAVTIALGSRGKLYALLRSGNFMDWPGRVAIPPLTTKRVDPQLYRRAEIESARSLKGVREISKVRLSASHEMQNWPDLVRFEDESRPDTIKWVDPTKLDSIFGRGYAVRRVTIQIVEAPVTRSIFADLPWLADKSAEARLPVRIERSSDDMFIPPLSFIDFTRSVN